MPELMLHDRPVRTIFDLLGYHENDLTKSLGWALARSPRFGCEIVRAVIGHAADEDLSIRLQEFGSDDGGYTDVEVASSHFAFILEAKLGWGLPSHGQLERYCGRLDTFDDAKLVSVSQWSADFARHHLRSHVKSPSGKRIAVSHLSWSDIANYARRASNHGSRAEKRLLADLVHYLQGVMNMQNQRSNYVFVVPLSRKPATMDSRSTVDVKNEQGIFWYPMGKNRLKKPPNYIGFYYDGHLHSVHHVEQHEVAVDLASARLMKGIKASPSNDAPHLVFKLGPPIKPVNEVKNGRIWAGTKIWCMLDALLTSATIAEAREETKRREAISL